MYCFICDQSTKCVIVQAKVYVVTDEITMGNRRIFILLSPMQRAGSESLRE